MTSGMCMNCHKFRGHDFPIIRVTNGPSKTTDFANFSSKFTGLVVLLFSGYVHLTVSIFPTKWSHDSHFFCKVVKVLMINDI